MSPLVTTGIDGLSACPAPGRGWTVSFRSRNEGMHHQLYANGRLAAWTDLPRQRHFFTDEPDGPTELVAAAADEADRTRDLSAQLPPAQRQPGWVFRAVLAPPASVRDGDVLQLLGDHATGVVDGQPLAQAEAWPARQARWAFGQDRFGAGLFGYDGANAPGLGQGAMGAGPFGIDSHVIELSRALGEGGTHRLVLRTCGRDGQTADAEPLDFAAAPPPRPPTALRATAYEPATGTLTLEWELSEDDQG